MSSAKAGDFQFDGSPVNESLCLGDTDSILSIFTKFLGPFKCRFDIFCDEIIGMVGLVNENTHKFLVNLHDAATKCVGFTLFIAVSFFTSNIQHTIFCHGYHRGDQEIPKCHRR